MPAAFSPEGRIESWLRESECSGRQLVEIARNLNVRIAHGPFAEALTGKKPFDHTTGERLLEVLDELKSLHEIYPDVPIHWGSTERVTTLAVLLRINKITAELDRQTAA